MQPTAPARDVHIRPGFDPLSGAAYLFDIDGTLLNTKDGVHWNAFRSALREVFGIESLLDTVPVHGNTDIGILRAVASQHGIEPPIFERELARTLEIMRAEVARNGNDVSCELCPGVRDFLDELCRQGKVLGVVSGNLESIGWRKIEMAGLRGFFRFGAFSDSTERRVDIFYYGLQQARKLLPWPDGEMTWGPRRALFWRGGVEVTRSPDCIFIGDSPADIAAARSLGAPIIAVATGIFSFADLLASSPDACVPCCGDLLSLGQREPR